MTDDRPSATRPARNRHRPVNVDAFTDNPRGTQRVERVTIMNDEKTEAGPNLRETEDRSPPHGAKRYTFAFDRWLPTAGR